MKKEIIEKLLKLNKDFYDDEAISWDISRKKVSYKGFSILESLKFKNDSYKKDGNFYNIHCNKNSDELVLKQNKLKILDLGSGNGRLNSYLGSLGMKYEYLGLDGSKELIKISKTKYPDRKFEIFDIVHSDYDMLKEKYGTFDLICCFAVLHHIPSQELRDQIIINIKKLLSKDGILVISNWDFLSYIKDLIVEPETIGIKKEDLEENDYILSWENKKFRYLHYLEKLSI